MYQKINKNKSELNYLIFALTLGISTAYASNDATQWVNEMSSLAQKQSYSGVFVYSRNDDMTAMKITHLHEKGRTYEQLVSLNSEQAEVVRNNHGVKCTFPKGAPVISDKSNFSESLSSSILNKIELAKNYQVSLGELNLVAGRRTKQAVIRANDDYRYSYRIWLDTDNGLMLKSQLLNTNDDIIEQMMFTSIEVFDAIPDYLRSALIDEDSYGSVESDSARHIKQASDQKNNWRIRKIPDGFSLAEYQRLQPSREKAFEHLFLTDGIAAVSVFVEEKGTNSSFVGASKIGVINAYGNIVDNHQITVVGEVPMSTLMLVGDSIEYSAAGLQ
ncbi:MAG: MucB/RseB C-terminal domain-containing protein [Gammaproteobacteria bacterium]